MDPKYSSHPHSTRRRGVTRPDSHNRAHYPHYAAHPSEHGSRKYAHQPTAVAQQVRPILSGSSQRHFYNMGAYNTQDARENLNMEAVEHFGPEMHARNVHFRDVETETNSPTASTEPPVTSHRFELDPYHRHGKVDEFSPQRISKSSRVYAGLRRDRGSSNYTPHQQLYFPGSDHHKVNGTKYASDHSNHASMVQIHNGHEIHSNKVPNSASHHWQLRNGSARTNPQVEVINLTGDGSDQDEDVQVPSSSHVLHHRYQSDHSTKIPHARRGRYNGFDGRGRKAYDTEIQGYVTDADYRASRHKDRPRSRVRRREYDCNRVTTYAQTDDEGLMPEYNHHIDGSHHRSDPHRPLKRGYSPDMHVPPPSQAAPPIHTKRLRAKKCDTAYAGTIKSQIHELEIPRLGGALFQGVTKANLGSQAKATRAAPAFMDEGSDEDPWPLPDNKLDVKDATEEEDSPVWAQNRSKLDEREVMRQPVTQVPARNGRKRDISGESGSQVLRTQVGHGKVVESVEQDVEMTDLLDEPRQPFGRAGLPNPSQAATRVSETPPAASAGLYDCGSPCSLSSQAISKLKLNPRQRMREAARQAREFNTEEEYTRATASQTPQPSKPRLKLSTPRSFIARPEPSVQQRDSAADRPIEISSAEPSDDSDTTSSEEDDEDADAKKGRGSTRKDEMKIDSGRRNAKFKDVPVRELKKLRDELPSALATEATAEEKSGATAVVKSPARKRANRTSNAAIIRKALRKQAKDKASDVEQEPRGRPPKSGTANAKAIQDQKEEESAWKQAMTALDEMQRSPSAPRRPNSVGHEKESGDSTTTICEDGNHSAYEDSGEDEDENEDEDLMKRIQEREEAKKKVAKDKKALARVKARQALLEAEIEAGLKRAMGVVAEKPALKAGKEGDVTKKRVRPKKVDTRSPELKSAEFVEEESDDEELADADNGSMKGKEAPGCATQEAEILGGADTVMLQTGERLNTANQPDDANADEEFDSLFTDPQPAGDSNMNGAAESDTPARHERNYLRQPGNGSRGRVGSYEGIGVQPSVKDGGQSVGGTDEQGDVTNIQSLQPVQNGEGHQDTLDGSPEQAASPAPITEENATAGADKKSTEAESSSSSAQTTQEEPADLQSMLAGARKEPPKNQDNCRYNTRKTAPISAMEAAQHSANRREQALAKGPLKTVPQSLEKILGSQSAPFKKTQGVNGIDLGSRTPKHDRKPKTGALLPTPKPKSQINSVVRRKAERLPREDELLSRKITKRNGVSVAPGYVRRPSTVLNDPESTDFGPLVDKTPTTPWSVITEDDKNLHHWKEKGLKWEEIRTLYAALTGKAFSKRGLVNRLERVRRAWPELQKEEDEKEKESEPRGLAALVTAKDAEKDAHEGEQQQQQQEPPQLGGKKWDPNAYEQYRANQQALADFLTDGEASDEEAEDYEESDGEEDDGAPTMVARTVFEPEPLDENEVWFQYHVRRKYWGPNESEDQVKEEIEIGPAGYNTMWEANMAAGKEIQLRRFGLPGASVDCRSFSCVTDDDGMQHYRAESAWGTVLVSVSRSLRSPLSPGSLAARPAVTSARSAWQSKRQWVVRSKEIHTVVTHTCVPGLPPDTNTEDHLNYLFEPPAPHVEKVLQRHERNHRLLGAYTVFDMANIEAGRALLEMCAPRSQRIDAIQERMEMKKEIDREVKELEKVEGLLARRMEMRGCSGAEAPVEVEVWVEECVLGGPRNV